MSRYPLALNLLLVLACYAMPSQASFIALDPTESGEIQREVNVTLPFSLTTSYSHSDGLDGIELISILGNGPPVAVAPPIARDNVGYMIFDLASLIFNPTHAALQFSVNSLGPMLEDLKVTSVDTLSALDLANLGTGSLPAQDGSDLWFDLFSEDTLGEHALTPGSSTFNIDLNAQGLGLITGAGNGLLALGLTYNWGDNIPDNARIDFISSPQLLLSDAPIPTPLPGTVWLVLLAGAALFARRGRA